MEIKYTDHIHVKIIHPSITLINLQPFCSAFSPQIILPPYFKQYSKGFHVALQAANLHLPKFTLNNFRIWTPVNLSKITPIECENLKKLTPTPAIPINQLRAYIANFSHIEANKAKSWIYYIGGGSGSGFLLLLAICGILYWGCKHPQSIGTRSPSPIAYTVPENPNMMHANVGAIRPGPSSALGQETVGIQDSVGNKRMVLNCDMQNTFASALLGQLEDLGSCVKEHCRGLRTRQYSTIPTIEN